MKHFLSFMILFHSIFSFSQTSLELSYNDVYIGRNMGLSWKHTVTDFSVSAGLTFHINRLHEVPISTFIKKSAYAVNFGERIGIQFGLEYFLFGNEYYKLGLFYNHQTSFISQQIKTYLADSALVAEPQSEFDFLYIKKEQIAGPFLTSDNVIGLTMRNKLSDNFYLTSKAGLGILLWTSTDESVIIVSDGNINFGHSFTGFLSAGVGYTFQKKKPQN